MKPHTFTPANDSFDARVSGLKQVHRDSQNIKKSLKLSDSPDWSNRLGSKEEILQAQAINENSLKVAVSSLSKDDVSKLSESESLPPSMIQEIMALHRQHSMQNRRQNQTSDQNSTSHKQ